MFDGRAHSIQGFALAPEPSGGDIPIASGGPRRRSVWGLFVVISAANSWLIVQLLR
ncbi:hypothetical protein [Pseudomonas sp. RA_35y_Pfl2_P32]|uniref:hypothetical protein n=1 Tax=Pseudomonas sp. RA_35y_Pfl2_P32 TaxID=3088705 RepID=UPI0030D9097D